MSSVLLALLLIAIQSTPTSPFHMANKHSLDYTSTMASKQDNSKHATKAETIGTETRENEKILILIRHARSLGNDLFDRPGNEWGSPTFCDDASLVDAPLSKVGRQQAESMLKSRINDKLLQDVELVIVSPLTRTLETFEYGVWPNLKSFWENSASNDVPPILAQPLATERVYTTSDTGRSVDELKIEFPHVDFSLLDSDDNSSCWWYNTNTSESNYEEWRPHGEDQWYGVPGEPAKHFEERMQQLVCWIRNRPERKIMLVSHWGVLRYLTGKGFRNCEVKEWEWNGQSDGVSCKL